MKKLIITLIAILGLFNTDTAQAAGKRYVTVVVSSIDNDGNGVHTDVLNVPSGKYVSIKNIIVDGGSIYVKVEAAGEKFNLLGPVTNTHQNYGSSPIIIAGPAKILLWADSPSEKILLTYEINPVLPE